MTEYILKRPYFVKKMTKNQIETGAASSQKHWNNPQKTVIIWPLNVKKYSTLLVTNIQIKTTKNYHCKSTRMVKIIKIDNTSCW